MTATQKQKNKPLIYSTEKTFYLNDYIINLLISQGVLKLQHKWVWTSD